MNKKNRYIYKKIDGYYFFIDTVTNEKWFINKFLVSLLNTQDKKINELEDSLREANECLSQIYSHLGVEAFGKDIQEQAVKEIDRLMDL